MEFKIRTIHRQSQHWALLEVTATETGNPKAKPILFALDSRDQDPRRTVIDVAKINPKIIEIIDSIIKAAAEVFERQSIPSYYHLSTDEALSKARDRKQRMHAYSNQVTRDLLDGEAARYIPPRYISR